MGFGTRKWLYSCFIIGLTVLFSNNFCLAGESSKVPYAKYMHFESLKVGFTPCEVLKA